jgi:hypothetical protein
MANVIIKGKFQGVYPVQTVTADFSKRLMCVDTGEAFHNLIVMDLHKTQTNDKLNLMDGYKKGDDVEVTANVICRKVVKNGVTSWFTTLVAWAVRTAQVANDFDEPEEAPVNKQAFFKKEEPAAPVVHPTTGEDLPF